ncbi:RICIN domain-containing protein [Streptomyces sp. DSM 15324]|nr:RICIN domain-containing protein [Streptomyces sp. DSM 15324]
MVVNRNSGKVLDVSGGGTADGAALIQYRDTGGTSQRWSFHRVTG